MSIIEIIRTGDEKTFEKMLCDLVDSPAMNYILNEYVLENCCIDEEDVADRCKYFRSGYGCTLKDSYGNTLSNFREKCKHFHDNKRAAYEILKDWFTKEIES